MQIQIQLQTVSVVSSSGVPGSVSALRAKEVTDAGSPVTLRLPVNMESFRLTLYCAIVGILYFTTPG